MNTDGSAEGDLSDPVLGDIVHGKDGGWVRRDNWYSEQSCCSAMELKDETFFVYKRFEVEYLCKYCTEYYSVRLRACIQFCHSSWEICKGHTQDSRQACRHSLFMKNVSKNLEIGSYVCCYRES